MKKKFITYIMLLAVMFTVGINGVMALGLQSIGTLTTGEVTICNYETPSTTNTSVNIIYSSGNIYFNKYEQYISNNTGIQILEKDLHAFIFNEAWEKEVSSIPLSPSKLCPQEVYYDNFGSKVCVGTLEECKEATGAWFELERLSSLETPVLEAINVTNLGYLDEVNYSSESKTVSMCHNAYDNSDLLERYNTDEFKSEYEKQLLSDFNSYYKTNISKFSSSLDQIVISASEALNNRLDNYNAECNAIGIENNDAELVEKTEEFDKKIEEVRKELSVDLNTTLEGCDLFNPLFLELIPIIELIQIGLIAGLIVLTILDFIKALVSEKDDEFKKAFNKIIKRVIIIAILFILPILIDALIGVFIPDLDTCLSSL